MDEGDKHIYVDSSDSGNDNAQPSKENPSVATPVSIGSSGKGFPYAPEGWPSPGDIWRWKVGRRRCVSGHWLDRSLFPPKHLPNIPMRGFHSRLSLQQYIQKEYPKADVDAFFASFSWKIPAAGDNPNELKRCSSSKNLEVNGCSKSDPTNNGLGGCKAGNKMCSLRAKAKSFAVAPGSCNICCSETGFCRDCCCILCCKTVDWVHGGYSFIKCEAAVNEKFICGHVAHVDCALRAYLAGKVGGSLDLDAQYFCRRCDNKTDLMSHVTKLIKTCESLKSREDIENILNLGSCILRGSEQETAKDLHIRIELVIAKLKHGVSLVKIWREENNISTPATRNIPLLVNGAEVTMSGALEIKNNSTTTEDSMDEIEHFPENDVTDGKPQGTLYITSDHDNLSLKLEDKIDGVLRELKSFQESEYRLAERKLYEQKDFLLSLYQQLEAERSELSSPVPLASGTDCNYALTSVLNSVDQIKHEEAKFMEMIKIAKGFCETRRSVLSEYFGPSINN